MGTIIGPLSVRRSAFIQASAGRVWQEFESFERLQGWLSRGHVLHQFETLVGGVVELSVEIDGAQHFFGGRVLVWEPAVEVTFESQWREPDTWQLPTLWTIRLSPLYDGTHVELFHHGFERLGAEAASNLQSYESGWDNKHLKALRSIVEG